jgi:hypothetical protein
MLGCLVFCLRSEKYSLNSTAYEDMCSGLHRFSLLKRLLSLISPLRKRVVATPVLNAVGAALFSWCGAHVGFF